jgi:hypothetical protein
MSTMIAAARSQLTTLVAARAGIAELPEVVGRADVPKLSSANSVPSEFH